MDYLSGNYIINPLEPKLWADDPQEQEEGPEAFRKATRLSQHIAFLKDFFRSYKDFTDGDIEEIMEKVYLRTCSSEVNLF